MLTILFLFFYTFLTFSLYSTLFTPVFNSQLTNSMTTTSIFSTFKFTPLVLLSTENLRILVNINVYLSSFSPWSRKVAWIRALVNRAFKICNTETLLKDELQHIQNFMSWNGFPRKFSLKLIEQFKPPLATPIDLIIFNYIIYIISYLCTHISYDLINLLYIPLKCNLQSWTKLLRKFRKNTIKLLTIIFTRLCEPPFPHSMLYILTSHYMRTKSNIVQGEGGVIVNKRHKFILIEPKLYMSVNFLNRFCPRLSGFQCLLCVIF